MLEYYIRENYRRACQNKQKAVEDFLNSHWWEYIFTPWRVYGRLQAIMRFTEEESFLFRMMRETK